MTTRNTFFETTKKSPVIKSLPYLAIASLFVISPDLLAQEEAESSSVLDGIKDSIWGLLPIFLCAFLMIGLIIYNAIQLTKAKFCPDDLKSNLAENMANCRVRSAIEIASGSPTYLGRMATSSLPYVDATETETLGKENVEDAMAEFSLNENRSYLNWIGYFSILSQVAPMLGLLGTVVGMIGAFAKLTQSGGADPSQLAGNISLALYTTAGGLIVAIPASFCYFFFRNRFNKLVADCHNAEQEMLKSSIQAVNADQFLTKIPEGLSA